MECWDGTLDVKSSRGTSTDSSGIRPQSSHPSLPSSLLESLIIKERIAQEVRTGELGRKTREDDDLIN